MAKDICIIILILIFIIIICVFAQWFIIHHTDQMLAAIEPMEAAINDGDWDKAKEHFQTAKEEWEKSQKIWKAISDHQDMRDVEVSLVDMEIILEQEDSAKAQKELQDLLFYLNHVKENEKLYLENIL